MDVYVGSLVNIIDPCNIKVCGKVSAESLCRLVCPKIMYWTFCAVMKL